MVICIANHLKSNSFVCLSSAYIFSPRPWIINVSSSVANKSQHSSHETCIFMVDASHIILAKLHNVSKYDILSTK